MTGERRSEMSSGNPGKHKRPAALHSSASTGTSSLLNAGKLKALYTAMVKCRMLEDRLAGRSRRQGHRTHLKFATGEEALFAGTALDLLRGDCITPSPRAFLARWVRGTSLADILADLGGKYEAPARGILQLGLGAGMALAFKGQKSSHVALCVLDEESLPQSGWKEALAFASRHKLPLVCVVATRSNNRGLRSEAEEHRAPTITVDGSDVVAVYRVAQEAIRRARQGYGPTLIEGKLHKTDPLDFMEAYLRNRGLWSDRWSRRLVKDFRAEMEKAARAVK